MIEFMWENLGPGGERFQALVCALLFRENRTAKVYGRLGRDCGIDAITEHGTRVVQMKYSMGKASEVISRAKKEHKKIKGYREGGACSSLWNGIREWELATNVAFNPINEEAWNAQIVPLFAELGLKAILTKKLDLEGRLLSHQDLCDAFFSGMNRVFLSLAEIRESSANLVFDVDALEIPYVGRDREFTQFREFLGGDQRILRITGKGGVGKTRFLFEAADSRVPPEWQVLWANTETMADRSDWIRGVAPDVPTLLCLDDPPPALLSVLMEQASVATGPFADWKIALTARPTDRDLLSLLDRMPGQLQQELEMEQLSESEAITFAGLLLEHHNINQSDTDWIIEACNELYRLSGGIPLWIVMPVRILKREGSLRDLPGEVSKIANRYVADALQSASSGSQAQLLETLRWISLLRDLNIEDELALAHVVTAAGFSKRGEMKRVLYELCSLGLLFRRGVRDRVFFIKPDPLADKLLEEWVCLSASATGVELADTGKELCNLIYTLVQSEQIRFAKAIANGLMRCMLLLKYEYEAEQDLLEPLFSLLHDNLGSLSVSTALSWIDFLDDVAPLSVDHVLDFVQGVKEQRFEPEEEDSLFLGKRILTTTDVHSDLPWLLYCTGQYVSSESQAKRVFDCYLDLIQGETDTTRPPGGRREDKGKTAEALLPRVLSERANFPPFYLEVARNHALMLLRSSTPDETTRAESSIPILDAVISPLLAEEHLSPSFTRSKLVLTRTRLGPGSRAWEIRGEVMDAMRQVLEKDDAPEDVRHQLWKMLTEAHTSLVRSRREEKLSPERKTDLLEDQTADLKWLNELLDKKSLGLAELRIASDIWDWHIRFDSEENIIGLSKQCEEKAKSVNEFSMLEPFTDHRRYEETREHAVLVAKHIAEIKTCERMKIFLERANAYFGEQDNWGFNQVAVELGKITESESEIQKLVRSLLNEGSSEFLERFALTVCVAWISDLSSQEEILEIYSKVLEWSPNEEAKAHALISLCSWRVLEAEELSLLYRYEDVIHRVGGTLEYLEILTRSARNIVPSFREKATSILEDMDAEEQESGVARILNTMHRIVLWKSDQEEQPFTRDEKQWLIDRIVELPRMGLWNEHTIREIREVLKDELPSISWLLSVLKKRVEYAANDDEYRLIPVHKRLSQIVNPVPISGSVSEEDKDALLGLLQFMTARSSLGYMLPEYLGDLDPTGRLVPRMVADKLRDELGAAREDAWRWVRVASVYEDGSPAWRTIAEPASDIAMECDKKGKHGIWNAIIGKNYRSWNAPVGQVAQMFYEDIERAKEKLDSETHKNLIPFRQRVLDSAQHALERERQRIEEETV